MPNPAEPLPNQGVAGGAEHVEGSAMCDRSRLAAEAARDAAKTKARKPAERGSNEGWVGVARQNLDAPAAAPGIT